MKEKRVFYYDIQLLNRGRILKFHCFKIQSPSKKNHVSHVTMMVVVVRVRLETFQFRNYSKSFKAIADCSIFISHRLDLINLSSVEHTLDRRSGVILQIIQIIIFLLNNHFCCCKSTDNRRRGRGSS
jgi:hypothetical protein